NSPPRASAGMSSYSEVAMAKTRVLIVDDSALVRSLLGHGSLCGIDEVDDALGAVLVDQRGLGRIGLHEDDDGGQETSGHDGAKGEDQLFAERKVFEEHDHDFRARENGGTAGRPASRCSGDMIRSGVCASIMECSGGHRKRSIAGNPVGNDFTSRYQDMAE
ncbi:MAG: hypothetical protein ACK4S3_10625, partial [Parvibaculum sp.]